MASCIHPSHVFYNLSTHLSVSPPLGCFHLCPRPITRVFKAVRRLAEEQLVHSFFGIRIRCQATFRFK